jgi:hypothetical protein
MSLPFAAIGLAGALWVVCAALFVVGANLATRSNDYARSWMLCMYERQ